MPGFTHDAHIISFPHINFDAFRAGQTQRDQSLASVKFDSRGNVIYKIPKQSSLLVEATLTSRHYQHDSVSLSNSPPAEEGPVYTLLEERGPFTAFWFYQGIELLLTRHFVRSIPDGGSFMLGSNGGSYAKTDTWSVHPGWTLLGSSGSGFGLLNSIDMGATVLSSSFPSQVLGFGNGSGGEGIAPETIGAADYVFLNRNGISGPLNSAIHAVFQGIGTHTAVSCIGTDAPGGDIDHGTILDRKSIIDLLVEFRLTDITAAESVLS